MKRRLLQTCTVFGLFALSAATWAQDASADRIIETGLQVLKQIDSGQTGEVWENSAAFMKARFPKAELTAMLGQSRQSVGSVAARTWASINRVRYAQDTQTVPAGLYANVDYSTRLADGRTVFELVSFRQEADGSWRLTGYVPRQTQ